MSKNHNNKPTTEEVVKSQETVETPVVGSSEEAPAPAPETKEEVNEAPADIVPDSVKEEPKVDVKKEEKPELEPVKSEAAVKETAKAAAKNEGKGAKKVVEVSLAKNYDVRFCNMFSNKRLAVPRSMPLFNIIHACIHNRATFIGFTDKDDLAEAAKFIADNPINIEGIKVNDATKNEIITRLTSNTDYVHIKWVK